MLIVVDRLGRKPAEGCCQRAFSESNSETPDGEEIVRGGTSPVKLLNESRVVAGLSEARDGKDRHHCMSIALRNGVLLMSVRL